MKMNLGRGPVSLESASPQFRRLCRLFIAAGAVVVLIGLLHLGRRHELASSEGSPEAASAAASADLAGAKPVEHEWRMRPRPVRAPARTAEEIVAAKVNQFSRSRRQIVRAIARRSQREVPAELEEFFDALESGRWDEIQARWQALRGRTGQYEGATHSPELDPFWPAVLDAYGAAQQAQLWPAQKLLDYGQAILDSLRPGMIYVGGTDSGRWIPTLLNETSGGEPHIIVTQNALADGRYLEYVDTLYSDRMTTLTSEDCQRAFKEYIDDAQKRLQHDEQFPDEPQQVRPGENIQRIDGRIQVSGQVAVMDINERLLQALMQKNPDLPFAIQESFPLKGTYADALPLGPLMELRAPDNAFTPERAAQSLDYWRQAAQQVLSDPEAASSSVTLKSYSHDAVSAGNLLAAHHFSLEAEQAYRLAAQLWPENPEPIGGLADLLVGSGLENDARKLLEDFARQYPDQKKDLERLSAAWRVLVSARDPPP